MSDKLEQSALGRNFQSGNWVLKEDKIKLITHTHTRIKCILFFFFALEMVYK